MEGNKSAMYEQAGRNRGWTQGFREEVTASAEKKVGVKARQARTSKAVAPTVQAAPVVIAAPAATIPDSVHVSPTIPAIPAPPIVSVPELEVPAEACQTLAMAYITAQKWQELYEPEQGLSRGTIFAELDLPFVGEGACKHE